MERLVQDLLRPRLRHQGTRRQCQPPQQGEQASPTVPTTQRRQARRRQRGQRASEGPPSPLPPPPLRPGQRVQGRGRTPPLGTVEPRKRPGRRGLQPDQVLLAQALDRLRLLVAALGPLVVLPEDYRGRVRGLLPVVAGQYQVVVLRAPASAPRRRAHARRRSYVTPVADLEARRRPRARRGLPAAPAAQGPAVPRQEEPAPADGGSGRRAAERGGQIPVPGPGAEGVSAYLAPPPRRPRGPCRAARSADVGDGGSSRAPSSLSRAAEAHAVRRGYSGRPGARGPRRRGEPAARLRPSPAGPGVGGAE